ncbi:MAG: hypothetical protein H7222_09215 [Methylotenera sp.]|nr:hypothetical protein [Oligoflexia bacterium]
MKALVLLKSLTSGLILSALCTSLVHARILPKPIDCTAVSKAGSEVQLVITQPKVTMTSKECEKADYPVIRRFVDGQGVSGRTRIYLKDGGSLSFHDVYGCLSDAQGSLGANMPLSKLNCVVRDVVKCPGT